VASGGSVRRAVSESHDSLRFGLDGSVKAGLAPAHQLQATLLSEARFWKERKKLGADAVYGSAFNIRKDLDAQIISRFQRPHGAWPSSVLGYEALTGFMDDFRFEDYLNGTEL
ncbi:cyclin-B1-2-like, partial [Phragmites australis]|uniref:cyclin-B1-2-like n=1 Tax=Phragmites australis TaxID=29695 RepID=UPI002D794877